MLEHGVSSRQINTDSPISFTTISQTKDCTRNGDDQKAYGSDHQDQNQKDKKVVCLNTAVNNAGRGFNNNVPLATLEPGNT